MLIKELKPVLSRSIVNLGQFHKTAKQELRLKFLLK